MESWIINVCVDSLILGNLNRRSWNMIVENEEYYLDGKFLYEKSD